MGSDKLLAKKCGEILINIKKNKKSKAFTFNCLFCNINCDQLKKFTQHLEQKHLPEISQDSSSRENKPIEEEESDIIYVKENVDKDNIDVLVPEIKVELAEIEQAGSEEDNTKTGEDPLETNTRAKAKVRIENDDYEDSDDEGDMGHCLEYHDSVDGSSCYESDEGKISPKNQSKPKEFTVSEDESSDSDVMVDDEKHGNKTHTKNKAQQQMADDKELTIVILQALEKQPVLWNVKSRSHNKVIRQARFQEIAKEVNEKLQIQIKWEFIRKRIKDIRTEYSYEYDKQMKGEKCEMPWYAEYMKFLKENIEALVKHRFKKKKYKRLKTLDDSHIPIFIQYYKNCEILWQVNNISFVLKTKKSEALKQIIQDLKQNHSIDINIQDMQRRIDYLNRLYSADKEQQLKCEQDKREFVPSSKYYQELSFLSDSQGPFKCSHCNEIIAKFEKYHVHVSEHTNIVPFKCALCEVRFKKLSKYIVHAKRHLGLHKYHCDVCGKGYQFYSELEWHLRQHTGEEPYLCEICGASFRSQNSYDNHIRRHEKRFRYECHICKHGFNHPHKLKSHVKAHLNIRDILCNICGKGFTAMNHLRRHQQIHSETKRYKCSVCGKAFAQDAGLRAHRKQHEDVPRKPEFRKRKYNYD